MGCQCPLSPFARTVVKDRIPQPVFLRTDSFSEIAGILMEQHREEGVTQDVSIERVGIGGSPALEVTLCTLTVVGIVVIPLAYACVHTGDYERNWIGSRLKRELKLLLRGHGNGVGNIRHVETGKDAKHALMFLTLDLLGGQFLTGFRRKLDRLR